MKAMNAYDSAQKRLMAAGCANPTEEDILTNVSQWAAARAGLKRSSRAASQEADEVTRETTPLEQAPANVSDSASARVPPAPVEAAAHTLAERTGTLDLPLQTDDTAPVGLGLGQSSVPLGTGTEIGRESAQDTVLGPIARPATEPVRSDSPHVLARQRMSSEAVSCVSSESSEAPNYDVFTGARLERFDGITGLPLARVSPARLEEPAAERPASAGTPVTTGDEPMRP